MEASDFRVEIAKIDRIDVHPNAERLELAYFKGWQFVVQKGKYKAGDLVVYIPIDSVLPETLEAAIFGPDSKVKLHNHRVKTIKLRGAISQGLVLSVDDIDTYLTTLDKPRYDWVEGHDLTEDLGIKKYEPPVPEWQSAGGQSHPAKKTYKNPNFKTYTKMANFKYYIELFKPEDEVVITEKVHGTNFRAGWVPFYANTLWRKVQKFLGLAPKWVFVYGSHNVQISEKMLYNGFYDKNVYAEAVIKYELQKHIPKGRVLYGEIYGSGIQKGYAYGLEEERRVVAFDLMNSETGEYLGWDEFAAEMMNVPVPVVPVLHLGKMGDADLTKCTEGRSVLAPPQKVREGCIVKSRVEEHCYAGRKALKVINAEYLLGDQTDYH